MLEIHQTQRHKCNHTGSLLFIAGKLAAFIKKAGLGANLGDLQNGTMRVAREDFVSHAEERAVGSIVVDLAYDCVLNLKKKGSVPPTKAVSATMNDNDISGMFDKYSGGFEGQFGEIAMFYGGLDRLIGAPQKNIDGAIRAEHCDVKVSSNRGLV